MGGRIVLQLARPSGLAVAGRCSRFVSPIARRISLRPANPTRKPNNWLARYGGGRIVLQLARPSGLAVAGRCSRFVSPIARRISLRPANPTRKPNNWLARCGGGRICTYVGTRPVDLQSTLVDCLSTPPIFQSRRSDSDPCPPADRDDLFTPLEPTPRFELGTYALQKHCSTVELGRL